MSAEAPALLCPFHRWGSQDAGGSLAALGNSRQTSEFPVLASTAKTTHSFPNVTTALKQSARPGRSELKGYQGSDPFTDTALAIPHIF